MSSPFRGVPLPLGALPSVPALLAASSRRVSAAREGATMGTRYHLVLSLPERDDALVERAHAAADAALQRVDLLMSTWKDDSEVSRLNRLRAGVPMEVSAETFAVLEEAQRVSECSGGAFDVTAGRLVNAWGFGPGQGPDRGPRLVDAATRTSLGRTVGHRHLRLDACSRSVTKAVEGLYVDLSAIAKGFGVDEAARALERAGVHEYLVEVGGEVRAAGARADGRPWQVGIEQPQAEATRRARYAVPLRGSSLATSGDYRICFHHDGRRYSHEIDPRTGSPISHALASVSVIARECMHADAMATALIVLGPREGPALAERLGLAAFFVLREDDGALRHAGTSAFEALGGRALAA